jgi:broad specificity phosphatase PhoE
MFDVGNPLEQIEVQLICYLLRENRQVVPGATRLLLIRHAHVDNGEDRQRMCGWLDLPLSPTGELQLRRFRSEPSPIKPEVVYASSSSRARVTAEALAVRFSVQVSIDPQLREINCGALEGMSIQEVKDRYPKLWTQNAWQDNSDFAWPNGETYRDFRYRVFDALSRIARRHAHTRIPIVTHTGVISQVVGAIKGLSPAVWESYRPEPFTATEVIWSRDAPRHLSSFNVSQWW